MVIVNIYGGIGNQMFQWALARMLKERMDIETHLDMSYFEKSYARPYGLDVFKINPKFVENKFTKLIKY